MNQKRLKYLFLSVNFIFNCIFIQFSRAENSNFANSSVSSNSASSNLKGQVARIMVAGLGGAVFGVSTLSFYGKPQEHLGNVAIGAVLGLALGATYVTNDTWNETQYSQDKYFAKPPLYISWNFHF